MHKLSLTKGEKGNELFWETAPSNPYSAPMLEAISDENSKDVAIPVTSIPSPFARMQLFDTAFEFVTRSRELEGTSMYHKLVSDCLDVYELLFRIEELGLSNKLEIDMWTPEDLVDMEVETATSGEKVFAKTLRLYIETYNQGMQEGGSKEEPFNQLYIISFDSEPIAGTSPYTGFFTTANQIAASIDLYESRKFFDDDPFPLFKRDKDFQKFLYLYIFSNRLGNRFANLNGYLDISRNFIEDNELGQYIRSLAQKRNEIENFQELKYENNPIYIAPNIPFRVKQKTEEEFLQLVKNSDYLAVTSKTLSRPPIVLGTGISNSHWRYLKEALPQELHLPRILPPYEDRLLPGTSNKYPFLTVDDCLSEYIVELDYPLNTEQFFTGSEGNSKRGYLLPVKADYFKFFTLQDLKQNLKIEVTEKKSGNEYNVKLDIPVNADSKRGKITFQRTYLTVDNVENRAEGKGAVVTEKSNGTRLYMGFYPFSRFGGKSSIGEFVPTDVSIFNDFYKTLVYYEDSLEINCDFIKYDASSTVLTKLSREGDGTRFNRTSKDKCLGYATDYYELSRSVEKTVDITYDLIDIALRRVGMADTINALLIPRMKVGGLDRGDKDSYVSFDVGTTNTFVAFATNKDAPLALTTRNVGESQGREEDLQMVMLHCPSDDKKGSLKYDFNRAVGGALLERALYNEFMPSLIGETSQFKFPIKTAICWNHDVKVTDERNLSVLSNINVAFAFGNRQARSIDQVSSNLKWDVSDLSDTGAKNKLKCFIEELVIISRNTLLQRGFDPRRAKMSWFRPLSMSSGVSKTFSDIWLELYSNYFSKEADKQEAQRAIDSNLKMITESTAPFYELDLSGANAFFLNIDIGGGTSDLVFHQRDRVEFTTSMRFGGNALFGDGLNSQRSDKKNGIVQKYLKEIDQKLDNKDERVAILHSFMENENLKSQDLINQMFNIEEFPKMLQLDQDFKVLFLLHNAALFYHSAQLIKSKNLKMPQQIGLSGNGSKILEITNGSVNLNAKNGLGDLAKLIFEKVLGETGGKRPEFVTSSKPKESTAYGGIKGFEGKLDTDDSYVIDIGDGLDAHHYKEARKFKYQEIYDAEAFIGQEEEVKDAIVDRVADNVLQFFDLFLGELWEQASFVSDFNVSSSINVDKLKTYILQKESIKNIIINGVNSKINEQEKDLNETMFFYPITHFLYELSKELANSNCEFKDTSS